MHILSQINEAATNDPVAFIAKAEKTYDDEIKNLAEKILSNSKIKIVLIAGPSGSGKTTTAHILKDKLICKGSFAEVVSLDHFYLEADKMPKLSNGKPDFETVYSLDIPEIHRCFDEIIKSGKTDIPTFNFQSKKRDETPHKIDVKNGILIVEGLHGLNPVLTDKLNKNSLLKIYISANESVFDDENKRVLSSRQIRLARRMSRDYIYRATPAAETLRLWTSVVQGEEKYLYCFKDSADLKLVTFHSFEPCIFRNIIISLLSDLPDSAENYDYIMQTKKGLERFVPLEIDMVPETSLIREFIEGGVYEKSK